MDRFREGKNLDEIKAADPFADYNDSRAAGFINPDQWAKPVCNAVAAR
jgi:hypothetical protein